jgi:hypothetical protein
VSDNPFRPAPRGRRPAVFGAPIVDPAGWSAEDLAGGEDYLYRLDEDEVDEILAAMERVEKSGIALKHVTRAQFPLPRFARVMDAIVKDEVMEGRGFIFLRGLPSVGLTVLQHAIIQWGLGAYIGRATHQNGRGHLLEHVMNSGGDINVSGRGYNSPSALGFHADSADAFSLMCIRTAKSGGEHSIVSSVTLYNEMLKRRPDLVHELTFRFYRTRRGEELPGAEPFQRQPVFSITDGYFAGRSASYTITRAQKLPGVPPLTDKQKAAIDFYQSLSRELALQIDWQPGDISFVLNHVSLHARTAYEDWPERDRRRHLLRLWLDLAGERPVHADIAREMKGITLHPGVEPEIPMTATPVPK